MKLYQSGDRIVGILSESEGGYLVEVLADSEADCVGQTFTLSVASLEACYNPVSGTPLTPDSGTPLTD